jgi:hypothetical protein
MGAVRGVVLGGLLVVVGCGQDLSGPDVMRLARERGAIVSCNGLGYKGMALAAEDISKEVNVLYVDGSRIGDRKRFWDVLMASDPLDFTGHSFGSKTVRDLVKGCELRGKSVRAVYILDGFTSEKFPNSVDKVHSIFSEDPYIFGKQMSRGGLKNVRKNIRKSNHFNVTEKAKGYIMGEMKGYNPGTDKRGR